VISIEHKLETMLAIGSQVRTVQVSSEFIIDPDGAETVTCDGDEAAQVSVPLKANLCVHIALPHVKEVDGNKLMTASLQVHGKVCGKSKSSASA
jgi:hypothetical protein